MLYLWLVSIGVSGLSAELVYKNRETSSYFKTTGRGLEYATAEQQDNRTLVLSLTEHDFKYASQRLKKDK